MNAGWIIIGVVVIATLSLIVNVALAIGVYLDTSDLNLRRRKLYFGGSGTWFLATLVGGVLVALAYWIIHRSTLNPYYQINMNNEGITEE